MYWTLFRAQRRIFGAIVAALIVFGGLSGIVQAVDHNEAVIEQQVSQREAQFWRAVAGEGSGTLPVVASQLARDLNDILHDPEAINAFVGTSNRYGGITDAIGFDPFDETGLRCQECGPLDERTLQNLRLIADGRLADILATTEVPIPDSSITVTPLGLSVPATVALTWVVGGPLSLAGALMLTRRRFSSLQWENNGKQMPEKYGICILAGSFMGPYLLWQRLNRNRFQAKVVSAFPDHMEVVQQVDWILDRMEDSDQKELLRARRDELVTELESQTRSGEGMASLSNVDEMLRKVNDAKQHLKWRSEAMHELGGP